MVTDLPFFFSYRESVCGNARIGSIDTPHGKIPTPNFIFCATKASIKCVPSYRVEKIGVDIILANTYHLMLRPGAKHIAAMGGLHRFMHWNKPMFTDSGGYQVFAMGHGSVSEEIKKSFNRSIPKSLISIGEDEVQFKSYVNGDIITISPEISVDAQCQIGADLIVQFDECTPYHVDKQYTKEAMRRSVRWGDRSIARLEMHNKKFAEEKGHGGIMPQAMYGVIQGGVYDDLRRESVNCVENQSFFATAIGGSLGSEKREMYEVVSKTCSLLQRRERPLHLLGIGDIPDIFHGVTQGIDTFDCVHPTRIARHAVAIVPATIDIKGILHMKSQKYKTQDLPIDSQCPLPCCQKYSRAYIHYLFKAREFLGLYLLSLHNIGQITRLMREIRKVLQEKSTDSFDALRKFWIGF